MSTSAVELIVTGLLSGSVFAAIATLLTSKATAHRTNAEAKGIAAKLPAEVDSVVVQGAESAVLTMKAALDSATQRISQLEHERDADRERITELEAKVNELRRKVDVAEEALGEARRAGQALRIELEDFISEQARRK